MNKLPDEMTTSQKYFDYVHKAEELIENMGWLQTGENIREIVRDLILLDLVEGISIVNRPRFRSVQENIR